MKNATSPFAHLRRHGLALVALSTLPLLPAAPAAAQSLLLHHQGATVADLTVGDSLQVSVAGSLALTLHQLELRDETGAFIAAATARTDAYGNSPPALLWRYSGVVGCDPNANANPSVYRFATYLDAESALGGRTFLLEARIAGASGPPAASRSVALVTRAGRVRFFHSNAGGCPRFVMRPEEDVYVTGMHLPLGAATVYSLDGTAIPLDPSEPAVTFGDRFVATGSSPLITTLSIRPIEMCSFANSYLPADGPINQPGTEAYCPEPAASPYSAPVTLRLAPILVTVRTVNPQVACPPCP